MDEEKSNIYEFDSGNKFWVRIIVQGAMAGKRLSSTLHLPKRV
jgi:hypothetical protein